MFKNKKGDITDILSVVIIIFIVVTGFFIISFIIPYITNGLSTAGLNSTTEGANAINKLYLFGVDGIQKGVTWLFIGFLLSILISAFYSDTHPIWLFLYILMLIISVILASYLANAYETMINLDVFNNFQQTLLTSIMQHSVKIYIAIACLSFVVIFTKFAYSGGGGDRI